MKNFRFIIIGVIAVISSCTSNTKVSKETTNDIYILVDNTEAHPDSRENLVSTKSIIEMVKLGGSVTWQNVNAVTLNANQTIEISLPDDPTNFQKRNALEPFAQDFNESRKNFLGPITKGTDNSSIYKPVCQALAKLSKLKSEQKTLIIVSDMIENSQFGNFYRKQSFDLIKKQLDSSSTELKNPGNLKVIILYDPQGNPKHEKQFDYAMEIWAQLFEAANIQWEVKPNL